MTHKRCKHLNIVKLLIRCVYLRSACSSVSTHRSCLVFRSVHPRRHLTTCILLQYCMSPCVDMSCSACSSVLTIAVVSCSIVHPRRHFTTCNSNKAQLDLSHGRQKNKFRINKPDCKICRICF